MDKFLIEKFIWISFEFIVNCGFVVCVDVNDMVMDVVYIRYWS